MAKSIKKLLIEITIFVVIVAVAGHVAVNLWERFIVQDKLIEMKQSLDHLKVTVHNMGYAYDDLQRDLVELARINSKSSITRAPVYETIPCKRRRGLDDTVLEHLNLLFAKVVQDSKTRHKLIADKNISAHALKMAPVRNATTVTRYPLKATAVGSDPTSVFRERYDYKKNLQEGIYKCKANNNPLWYPYEDYDSPNKFRKY